MIHRAKKYIRSLINRSKKVVPVYIPTLQSDLLENRVALITGGTKGIGFEIAKSFLMSGASVVITGRDQERVDKSCNELAAFARENRKCCGCVLDNADVGSFNEKFSDILTMLGDSKVDILVNNAGILIGGSGFDNLSPEDWDKTIDTNLKGVYFISQIVAKYMKDNGIKGNILNIASSSSLRPAISPYTISKWGLRGLTAGLAKVLISYDIVVNGLAPGPTATSMLVRSGYDGLELPSNPAQRYATPQEIANMAVVLVSGVGRMVVGDIIYMTGGAGVITVDDMSYN